MVHPGAGDTSAVRATFFIDPNGVLRAMVYYPMSNGRSIDEFVRLLQALQNSDANGVATPRTGVRAAGHRAAAEDRRSGQQACVGRL